MATHQELASSTARLAVQRTTPTPEPAVAAYAPRMTSVSATSGTTAPATAQPGPVPDEPPNRKSPGANESEQKGDLVDKDVELARRPFPGLSATITNGSNADRPYSAFSEGEKWFIIVSSATAAIFSPISSNIYVPAIPTLAQDFGRSNQDITLTVTVYLVFQALTPSVWGSAADCYGRRPMYISCLLVYILSCVGTALCPTNAYWLLILMRILQATGGSCLIAIGSGVVGDIALPQERGKYMGIFNLTSTFGPAIGPLLGGVFAGTLGWRSIFWFLTISCTVVLVPMIFFFPETLRSLVGDGSIPPPLLNCTPAKALQRRRAERARGPPGGQTSDVAAKRAKFKPFASFMMALQPDIFLVFFWASLYYAQWYAVLAIFSTLLRDEYGTNDIIIGVSYIPNGIGTGVGSVVTGRLMDRIYRQEKQRVGGDHRHRPGEFQLERVRFAVLPWLCVLSLTSTIALGWSMAARAPIAVPIVLNFFVGLSTGYLTTVTIYGIDLFVGQGGAVTATFNLIRCLLGAASVSVVQLLNTAMGPGWTFVLFSGICALATPMPLVVMLYGRHWRLRRSRPRTRPAGAEPLASPRTVHARCKTFGSASWDHKKAPDDRLGSNLQRQPRSSHHHEGQ